MRPALSPYRFALLLTTCIAIAWSGSAVIAQSPGTADGSPVVIGTDSLNVRSCPQISCSWVTSADLGARLQRTGPSEDGFAPVRYDGKAGWAYDLYLLDEGEDPLVRQGVAGCDRVALIFNAGIGNTPSQTILDTVVSSRAPVTLFAMGWWAETYPDYLQSLQAANVVIGSHGNTQTFLTLVDDVQVGSEVLASADAIEGITGSAPSRYYTAYASDSDERVRQTIAALGYLPIGWTVSAADYSDDDTAEDVYARVMDNVGDGSIVELHLDGPATDVSTAVALPWIIADLEARGYELVTVPEILLPCQ
jgi:peptidoglycan/xylan/chitin deacetylase (PgdA/CDA1 family)